MIRINLLPVRRSKKRETATRELAIGGMVVTVVLIGLYIWYAVMASKVSAVEDRIAKTKADIQSVEQKIVQVEEFKKKKREFEQKLEVIDDLKAKKTGPVKLLDELAINLPKRVWLTAFDEKGGTMSLEGGAADNDELSDFLGYMTKRSKFFSGVSLAYSEATPLTASPGSAGPDQKPLPRINYVKFKLTGGAIYGTLPAPTGEKK